MKDKLRFLRFCLVGGSNTVITFFIYSVLVFFGVHFTAANIIGYSTGIINSYYWNTRWVFKKKDNETDIMSKFVIVNLFVLIINTGVLYFLVEILEQNEYLAQLVVISMSMILNYTLNKIWTFKDKEKDSNEY